MVKKLQAELWDKMHYLFRDFNDRMVHVELHYDYEIDIDALKTVVMCFFDKAPVYHSKFTDNRISPYWTINKYRIDDVVSVEEVTAEELDEKINDFLVKYIPPDDDLQMLIKVFKCDGKSVLCIIENHMCMDGGDFKSFLIKFCENYTNYVENGTSPVDFKNGLRNFESVYEDFSKNEEQMARRLYKNVNKKDNHGFPFTADSLRDKSFIARRRISADKFDALREAGKKYNATINDVFLACYFRALYDIAGFADNESVSISCAIDLRRYMDEQSREETGYTNQTAWMQCFIPEKGQDIFATLQYAARESQRFKRDKFMGLHGLPLLSFGYKIMPLALSENVIKIGYSNPLLAMSNIGRLDEKKLSLAGHEPTDGFMSGAVKYKPYALLSLTSLRKEFTLSMCCRGNDEDKEIIEKFFDGIEYYLNEIIEKA